MLKIARLGNCLLLVDQLVLVGIHMVLNLIAWYQVWLSHLAVVLVQLSCTSFERLSHRVRDCRHDERLHLLLLNINLGLCDNKVTPVKINLALTAR